MTERMEAIVGAKISEFKKKMAEVKAIAMGLPNHIVTTVDVRRNFIDNNRKVIDTDDVIVIDAPPDQEVEVNVDAKINDFRRKMAEVKSLLASIPKKVMVKVDLDKNAIKQFSKLGVSVGEVKKEVEKVEEKTNSLPRKIVIEVEARVEKFHKQMDRLANTINSFTTIGSNMRAGGLMAVLPAISPAIAGAAAVIGGLGPMIGVMAGGLLGLASAFTAAGLGAAGFATVAIPSIGGVIKKNKELMDMQKKAQEYLASGEMKKYKKELLKIKNAQKGLSKTQLETIKSLREFQKFFKTFTKQFETPVLKAFTNSMKLAQNVLKAMTPAITGATNAVSGLLQSFNDSLKAADVQNIFKWLGDSAGPAITTLGKAFGYAARGVLNMMAAFQPLAETVQGGFLGMMKRFSEWAAGLSKSEKFNKFMDYVATNGPKLLKIIGNISLGLVEMFAAFGPMSSDMMSGLVDLTGKFKSWATNLKNSESFKKFINYVKTNGPTMISVIGQIVLLIVNLLQGMAPLGAKILEIANSFLTWSNNMMDAHPIIGQIVAATLSIIGVLTSMIPLIIGWRVAFGGAIKFIGGLLLKFGGPIFAAFKNNLIIGFKMLGTNIATTAANFGKSLLMMGTKMRLWGALMAAQIRQTVARWVAGMAKMIAAGAKAVAKFVVQIAKMIGRWALLAARSLISAARVAAAWFIALGPIGWVIAIVIGLVALIIANWDKVKKWTLKAWSAVSGYVKEKAKEIWNGIKDTFNQIVDFLTGLGGTFLKAGKGLIEQMANGIKNAAGKVISQVKSLAGKVRDFLPFSPAKTGPLSDIDKLNFGGPIADSIGRARNTVRSALTDLLQVPDMAVSPSVGGSVPIRYDTKDKDITVALTSALESMVLDNTIEIDGEAVVKATGKPMLRYMGQETKKASRRTGGR